MGAITATVIGSAIADVDPIHIKGNSTLGIVLLMIIWRSI